MAEKPSQNTLDIGSFTEEKQVKLSKKLLEGSRILNEKRSETIEVLKILCGILEARAKSNQAYEFICADGYFWNVAQVIENNKARVCIRFMREPEEVLLRTSTVKMEGIGPKAKDMTLIHDNLDALIAGIENRFPTMLQPLLDAKE